ncbi:hypothetical protein BDR06DRAFT_968130 [Suillus hirtellus]|nr:hypothetical protein BDR06DRAFT_968130 [Suillus hirtellus]
MNPYIAKAVSFSAEQLSQASIGSSLSSIASHEPKIPKPDSEAGHPSHGGYNLEIAFKWDAGCFKVFKECIHTSIKKHCNTSKSKTSQTPSTIVVVQTEVLSHFSKLNDYDGCWPIGDIIQMQLKNTTAKQRLKNTLLTLDDDPVTPAVESYPLNELRPAVAIHTYPPQPVISASLDPYTSATPSSPATSFGEEFGIDLFDNP